MAAERDPSPPNYAGRHTLSSVRGDTASHRATVGGEVRTPLGVLSVVLKWVGVALLIVACLLAAYLGASLLGEWAVRVTYP
jgi:hypothetical protein